MPGVAQAVSSNVWGAISLIPDKELRGLAEEIFPLYDSSKFAEFGGVLVWFVLTAPIAAVLGTLPVVEALRGTLMAAAALGSAWPACRYCMWRKRMIGKKYEQILASHPRGPEAARLVARLYRESHPFS